MTMVVVLTNMEAASLSPESLQTLSGLGVTNLTLLADPDTLAVVLDGWAFDPDSVSTDALIAVLGAGRQPQLFRPLTQMALTARSISEPALAAEADPSSRRSR